MLKTILKIIIIIILVIIQLSLISKFSVYNAIPNLILILAISLVLRNHFNDAVLVAITGGLLFDLVSEMRFGIYTIIFLTIIILIQFVLLKSMPSPNSLITFLIFAVSFLSLDLVFFGFLKTLPSWNILLSSLINGLWGLLIFIWLSPKIVTYEEIILE